MQNRKNTRKKGIVKLSSVHTRTCMYIYIYVCVCFQVFVRAMMRDTKTSKLIAESDALFLSPKYRDEDKIQELKDIMNSIDEMAV